MPHYNFGKDIYKGIYNTLTKLVGFTLSTSKIMAIQRLLMTFVLDTDGQPLSDEFSSTLDLNSQNSIHHN
jgi:hypothetical protein